MRALSLGRVYEGKQAAFKVFLLSSRENCGQLERKLLIIAQTLREMDVKKKKKNIHCLSRSM